MGCVEQRWPGRFRQLEKLQELQPLKEPAGILGQAPVRALMLSGWGGGGLPLLLCNVLANS